MKEFSYIITDPQGIHARPAGALVKVAASFASAITIGKEEKEADAKRIFAIMSLGVRQGQTIVIKADGPDEAEAVENLEAFLKKHL